MCYFSCKAQKITIPLRWAWCLILGEIQDGRAKMATIIGDFKGLQQRHHP